MEFDSGLALSSLEQELQQIDTEVKGLAAKCQGDAILLLHLLRHLEKLHRDISQSMFNPSLPKTRHELYFLLRDIDETGGWPYIERMKIKQLLVKLSETESSSEESTSGQT